MLLDIIAYFLTFCILYNTSVLHFFFYIYFFNGSWFKKKKKLLMGVSETVFTSVILCICLSTQTSACLS